MRQAVERERSEGERLVVDRSGVLDQLLVGRRQEALCLPGFVVALGGDQRAVDLAFFEQGGEYLGDDAAILGPFGPLLVDACGELRDRIAGSRDVVLAVGDHPLAFVAQAAAGTEVSAQNSRCTS